METGSPRKIQFTVPLLDTHLDPEAAEQVRRKATENLKREKNGEEKLAVWISRNLECLCGFMFGKVKDLYF